MIDTKRLATDAAYWRECGAPDWATKFGVVGMRDIPIWYNLEKYQHTEGAQMHRDFKFANDGAYSLHQVSQPIPRPQSEWVDGLTGWDGVSAPAPGELAVTSGGKCQVLGWDAQRKQVAVQWYDGEMGVITLAALKPIPTKAQRDRDELIELILSGPMPHWQASDAADAIIAAGWTKP